MFKKFEYHKSWILLLSSMLFIVILTPIISSFMDDCFSQRRTELTKQRNRLDKQLEQWEKDNKTALDISQTISKQDVQNLLAAPHREAITAQIDTIGAKNRLGHLRYILSPSKPWDGGADFPGIKKIVTSTLMIEADAPSDEDIYAFMDQLNKINGKLILKKLSLKTKDDLQKLSAYNLQFKATYEWLMNEEIK